MYCVWAAPRVMVVYVPYIHFTHDIPVYVGFAQARPNYVCSDCVIVSGQFIALSLNWLIVDPLKKVMVICS